MFFSIQKRYKDFDVDKKYISLENLFLLLIYRLEFNAYMSSDC